MAKKYPGGCKPLEVYTTPALQTYKLLTDILTDVNLQQSSFGKVTIAYI